MKHLLWLIVLQGVGSWAVAQTLIIEGKIVDGQTGEALPFANIGIKSNRIGSSANERGEFVLKIPQQYQNDTLRVSFVGYSSYQVAIQQVLEKPNLTIKLKHIAVKLKEVVIKPVETESIIKKVVKAINDNYSIVPALMQGFYRETVKRNDTGQFFAFAEGVLEVYKSPISKQADAVRSIKGRKKDLPTFFLFGQDTCRIPEITQGPHLGIVLDIVKHNEAFMTKINSKYYKFEFLEYSEIDDHAVYVFGFEPKNPVPYGYSTSLYSSKSYQEFFQPFTGKVFIDRGSLAVVRAEYGLTDYALERVNQANRMNPTQMPLVLLKRQYVINYSPIGSRWFLQSAGVQNDYKYAQNGVKIVNRMDFLVTETMVSLGITKFKKEDVIPFNQTFGERIQANFDDAFWQDFNIIR